MWYHTVALTRVHCRRIRCASTAWYGMAGRAGMPLPPVLPRRVVARLALPRGLPGVVVVDEQEDAVHQRQADDSDGPGDRKPTGGRGWRPDQGRGMGAGGRGMGPGRGVGAGGRVMGPRRGRDGGVDGWGPS